MHAPRRASRGARRRRARARRDRLSRPRRRRRGPRQPAIVLPALPHPLRPFHGDDERVTLLKTVVPDQVWALEQTSPSDPRDPPSMRRHPPRGRLALDPRPARPHRRVLRPRRVHRRSVRHVVVPTYALEHKIFARDALERWPDADLWVAPGQFAFPVEVSAAEVFGREPRGCSAARRTAGPARPRPGRARSTARCFAPENSRWRGKT